MSPDHDVERLLAELIRFDTTNFGAGSSNGERECATYVAELLSDAGLSPDIYEARPGRSNVVVRVPGSDPDAPAVLAHAHLDVVPATAADWSVHPFSGRTADGCVWGRGAVDMKNMAAQLLSVVRSWGGRGVRPRQDLVLAFVADEEDDGELGARFLVREHPDLFEGCVIGISEFGAFNIEATPIARPDAEPARFYPVAAGERGSLHMRVTAYGTAGHGSRPNPDNPVLHLIAALERVADYQWPVRLTPVVRAYLEAVGETLGVEVDLEDPDATIAALGSAGELVVGTVRNTAVPTMLEAGSKVNVIPSSASAQLDVRALPGTVDEVLSTIDDLLGPGIVREQLMSSDPLIAPIDTPWFAAMGAALRAEDADAVVIPYCMGGGTDAKPFTQLGIAGYGFSPLRVPPGFPLRRLAHGVDERVPIDGLRFGARVLDRFLLDDDTTTT